ncbi:MAG: hypothetical protein NTW28_36435, partial [Candidatus Solibacter sp.]|nr:hypothetical protein [Candidatus Solibacter sp.]
MPDPETSQGTQVKSAPVTIWSCSDGSNASPARFFTLGRSLCVNHADQPALTGRESYVDGF